jgi:hypothetical protein
MSHKVESLRMEIHSSSVGKKSSAALQRGHEIVELELREGD